MPKSAMTMSDDGSLVRYKMFSGLPNFPRKLLEKYRKTGCVLEISVHDIVVVQVLHPGQYRT